MTEHRTKWQVLVAKREALQTQIDELDRRMNSLAGQSCMLRCNKCDKLHETEADFARHYLIPDERYLNLGYCPTNTTATAIP